MTSVLGVSVPKVGITKQDLTSPRNLALGGIATTSLVGGGIVGALKGSPLKGLAIGGAIAAVALGAALIGNASSSQRDGWCDYYGDPDCYEPTVPGRYGPPRYDPTYPYDPGYDPYYPSYPDPGYPDSGYGRGTSPGDDY
ncbi:MAG: hypothetical protein KDC46_02095 [Thermoleophilia bacterium]|nr:hypothetical protein [Thermoleophilia bacterium]